MNDGGGGHLGWSFNGSFAGPVRCPHRAQLGFDSLAEKYMRYHWSQCHGSVTCLKCSLQAQTLPTNRTRDLGIGAKLNCATEVSGVP